MPTMSHKLKPFQSNATVRPVNKMTRCRGMPETAGDQPELRFSEKAPGIYAAKQA